MNLWRLQGLLLPLAALLAMACSPTDDPSETTSTTTLPFATTTLPFATTTLPFATTTLPFATTTSSEVALSDLVGDWDNGELFLQIADDGSYQTLETATSDPNDPLMGGFVARDGVNLIFVTNIYEECPGQTGVYEAAMTDGQLVLTLVDDPCEFRATRFVSPWEKSG